MGAEHLTNEQVAGAARGDLPPAELLRASDHLVGCAECRDRVRQMTAHAARPLEETQVTYGLLADYLDDQLDPLRRAELEEELKKSPRAASDLASLRSFRDETNALPADLTSEGRNEHQVLRFQRRIVRRALPLAALFLVAVAGLWWQQRPLRNGNLLTRNLPAGLSPDLRAAVLAAAETKRLPVPQSIVSLAGEREKLAGAGEARPSFELIRPIGTAIVETRPRFEWIARADATGYRVLVVDLRSGDIVATGESHGGATDWQPPNDLPAGETYQWQVEALRAAQVLERVPRPPEPEARFTILSAQAQRVFAQAEASGGGDHLVLAVAAARAGLLERAEAELRALAKQNPKSTEVRQLLQNTLRQPGYSRPTTTKGAQ